MTDHKRIAWELERTAMGDGYYADALCAAKELPEATPCVRALLDRWITGKQDGFYEEIDCSRYSTVILEYPDVPSYPLNYPTGVLWGPDAVPSTTK